MNLKQIYQDYIFNHPTAVKSRAIISISYVKLPGFYVCLPSSSN
ncbi:hypothetical protein EDF67_101161 [Sphingobacterium sp. JUb78]|nr:hypothetical protein [Sphingobacterium kitahiroshimense]TCR14058.1 hypothetical protein EDF67_101161 [Sphingobacterium sp. JUb78]